MPITPFPADGPCCSIPPVFADEINYTDNGNLWTLQGDMEPMGGAWAFANSSGLTIEYQSCYIGSGFTACGPSSENLANEGSMDSSIYGDLGAIPVYAGSPIINSPGLVPRITPVPLAQVFSIDVNIPYHSYYSGCREDFGDGGAGCTYEFTPGTMPIGTPSPFDSATFGFDVGGNYDIVSVAEVCNPNNDCASNELQLAAYTSGGGSSISIPVLNSTFIPYQANNNITIATDRSTFIDFYADNILLYSSSTLPIKQNLNYGTGVLEFSTRTSINNETDIVTFSNARAYSSSHITVGGLSSGMTVLVKGPNGFSVAANANSLGVASVDVSNEQTGLTVRVELNGSVIASYNTPVNAGSHFNLT
jgi:hypothetical protein